MISDELVIGVCAFFTFINLCLLWMNIKLTTENVKHRLLEK